MKFPTYKELGEIVAKEALDTFEYNGKTLREWIEIISAAELGTNLAEVGTDLVSRQAVKDIFTELYGISAIGSVFDKHEWKDICETTANELPSVQPEIIRCGQCKYAEVADTEDSQDGYTCQFHRGSIWFSGSYCSWAERRQDE